MKQQVSVGLAQGEPEAGSIHSNLSYLIPICLVATLGGLLFGYDTGVISGAIEPLTACFGLSDFMKGWASGSVLIGCAAGVVLAGPISDRFGRKRTLFLAALMFFASAIGTAVPREIGTFIVFRILGGMGVGVASIATPMYIAEITPASLRGRMVALNQITIVGGIAATAWINYGIAHSQGDPGRPEVQAWLTATGWRWMFAAGMVPSLIFGALLWCIPESPRWLIEKTRETQARVILGKIGGDQFSEVEAAKIKASLSREGGSWRELVSRELRMPLLLGIALAVLQQVTGINVFLYFGATIFRRLSDSTGVDAGLLQQIVINGACMLFTVVAIATVDRWGRKPLMILGAAGMAVSLLAMGAMAQWASNLEAVEGWMLLFIVLYIGWFGLSVGPVTWVILSEIFPTAVRGRALGLATFFLWTADYAVTQTFPLLDARGSWPVRHFHHAFPFYIYGGFCLVLIFVAVKFLPETKGRRLEEIEAHWRREDKALR